MPATVPTGGRARLLGTDTMCTMEEPEQSDVVAASTRAHGHALEGIRLAHSDSIATVGLRGVRDRESREELLDSLLSVGATRPIGAGNRRVEEEPDGLRTCFEKDLDRIRYARPFRRLAGKCQVFLAPDDIHLRTRLTHTLEVAQVAVAISASVGLNTTLAEAIAMGHDCGHGPGGHASEDAFAPFLEGGYDHALYGADVVMAEFNLCAETLDGIRHHSWRLLAPGTPEGEVVSLSDRIAYLVADYEDAVRTGLLTPGDLPKIVQERLGLHQPGQTGVLIGGVIEAIATTGRVGIVEHLAEAMDAFRAFNYERIYFRPASNVQNQRVVGMLRALVEHYADAPGLIPAVASGEWASPMSGESAAYETAVRYVAGMTDNFAIATARGMGLTQLPHGT
jgi:dGTPase